MRPNIEGIRANVTSNPLTVLDRVEILDVFAYIDELESMPLVQTVVKQREEIDRLMEIFQSIHRVSNESPVSFFWLQERCNEALRPAEESK